MKRRFVNWLQSPLMCCALVGTTLGAGAGWLRADAAHNAPQLERYEWSQHPDALMVVVPEKGCGCGPKPAAIAEEAVRIGKDVLVVSSASNAETKEVQGELQARRLPATKVSVLKVEAEVVKRFAAGEQVNTVEVVRGRVLSQSKGASSYQLLNRLWKAEKAKRVESAKSVANTEVEVSPSGGNHADV